MAHMVENTQAKMLLAMQAEMLKKTAATAAARKALEMAAKDEAEFMRKLKVFGGGKRAQGAAPKSKGITKKTPSGSGKNPNREKRPLSPYMVFCKEKRPNIISENPGMSFPDVGRALGAAWGKLSDAQKAAYKQEIAPLPAVPQSSGAGGAAKADAQMSDPKREDSEDSEDIEYDMDVEFEVHWEEVVSMLDVAYLFFDEDKLDPLSKLYLEQLDLDWLDYSEYKCDIFLQMTRKKVMNMEELNALIKKTFNPYLSEPCYNADLHKDKKWHTYVINAFLMWNQVHPRFNVCLDKFHDHSGLHLLTLEDFKKVEQKMNNMIKVKPFETWIAFATALLTECTYHRGPFDHDDHMRCDDYDFTCDFNTDDGVQILDHRSAHLYHLMHS